MAISFCAKRIISTRSNVYNTIKRKISGYYILLPEIGEDLPEKNPLINEDGLPIFDTFTVERSVAAISRQTALFEQAIERIVANIKASDKVDIVNQVIHPLEELMVPLYTTWGVANTLYFGNTTLMPQKYHLQIHNRMMKVRAEQTANRTIYNACKAALNDKNAKLTHEQRRIVEKFCLQGYHNGLDIELKEFKYFEGTHYKINEKTADMLEQVRLATEIFKTTVRDASVVKDFPEEFLRQIAANPKNPYEGPWIITLQPRIYSQFMKYCPDRELRWQVWVGYIGRCSMYGEHSLRTSSTLEDIRDNRDRQAKYIGFKSYAHMRMETKTAGTLENVYAVLERLYETARPAQEREIKALTDFATERAFDGELQVWDIDYWSRKYCRTVYDYKDEILCQWFPLPVVLNGLFGLIEELFDVKIVEGKKANVWHPDVRLYNVIDLRGSSREPIAHFYVDPYAREQGKQGTNSGKMLVIQNRSQLVGTKPLAGLIFNFSPPYGNTPSLLSASEVADLFRQMGAVLQHLLTTVYYAELSGLSNIQWDTVGTCGHFMTNWFYEPQVMKRVSGHFKTKQPLTDQQIESIQKARTHLAGYELCKELYYSKYDLELHETREFWPKIMKRLWKKYFVIPRDPHESHITAWVEVFCDHWGATYYSDLWSRMLAADIYSAFQEIPRNDEAQVKEVAMRYRDTFLSLGGSVHSGEIFRRFRGRDPNCKALLKNLGLKIQSDESEK